MTRRRCCCGETCVIYSDSFDRTSGIGADWIDTASDSSITDNEIVAGTLLVDARGGCPACRYGTDYGDQFLLEVDVELVGSPRIYHNVVYRVAVSGTITPDATGNYSAAGRYDGRAAFGTTYGFGQTVIFYTDSSPGPAYILWDSDTGESICYGALPTETITVAGVAPAGDYAIAGRWNGYLYYTNGSTGYVLWYSTDLSAYVLSTARDAGMDAEDAWWLQSSGDVISPGSYAPQGTASGTATVTAAGDNFWLLDGEDINWVGTYRPHGSASGDATVSAGEVYDDARLTFRYYFWKVWKASNKVKAQLYKHNKTLEVAVGTEETSTADVGEWVTVRLCSDGTLSILSEGVEVLYHEGSAPCVDALTDGNNPYSRLLGLGSGTFDGYSVEYHALTVNGCKRCICDYFSADTFMDSLLVEADEDVAAADDPTGTYADGGSHNSEPEWDPGPSGGGRQYPRVSYGVHPLGTGYCVLTDLATTPETVDHTHIWWYHEDGGTDVEGTYVAPYPDGVYQRSDDAVYYLTNGTLNGHPSYVSQSGTTGYLFWSAEWGAYCWAFDLDTDDAPTVTGTLSPDATGAYSRNGLYNSRARFDRDAGGWSLWWNSSLSDWVVSNTPGALGSDYWRGGGTSFQPGGSYTAYGGASGTGTVNTVHWYSINTSGTTPDGVYIKQGTATSGDFTVFSRDTSTGTLAVSLNHWDLVAGDWTFTDDAVFASTKWFTPTAANTTVLSAFEAAEIPYHVQLGDGSSNPSVENWTVGDQVRLIVNWVDSDNYSYSQIEKTDASEWELRLYNVDAGTETEVADVVTLDTAPLYWRVCVSTEWISTTVSNGRLYAQWAPILATGKKFGAGVGTLAGAPQLKYITLAARVDEGSATAACNDCSDCDHCENDVPPHEVEATIAGLTRYFINSNGDWCDGNSSAVPYPDVRGQVASNGIYDSHAAYLLDNGWHLWWSSASPANVYVISAAQGTKAHYWYNTTGATIYGNYDQVDTGAGRVYGTLTIAVHTPCDCTDLNDTYVMAWQPPIGCDWEYDFSSYYPCGVNQLRFEPGAASGLNLWSQRIAISASVSTNKLRPLEYDGYKCWTSPPGYGSSIGHYTWFSLSDNAYVISLDSSDPASPLYMSGSIGVKGAGYYLADATGGDPTGTYTGYGTVTGGTKTVTWNWTKLSGSASSAEFPPADPEESGDNCRDWNAELLEPVGSPDTAYCWGSETLLVADARLSPALSAYYTRQYGTDYNGQSTYVSRSNYIYYDGANWILTPGSVGSPGADYWLGPAGTVLGDYAPQGAASGTATVTRVANGATATITAITESL